MKKSLLICAMVGLSLTACHESLEDRAERECKEQTEKYCPVPVTEYVISDSMVFERATHTFHYYYSLRGIADTTALPAEEARKEMLEGLRNSTQLNVYKEAGYNFHYTYFSTKYPGQKIVDIKFTPKDYAQNAK